MCSGVDFVSVSMIFRKDFGRCGIFFVFRLIISQGCLNLTVCISEHYIVPYAIFGANLKSNG